MQPCILSLTEVIAESVKSTPLPQPATSRQAARVYEAATIRREIILGKHFHAQVTKPCCSFSPSHWFSMTSKGSQLLSHLRKLTTLDIKSYDIRWTAEDLLVEAFCGEKPLFPGPNQDKEEAAALLEQALPYLDRSFHLIQAALNSELLEHAKVYRSGLQYLIEEFADNQTVYEKLSPILASDGVETLEEYLKATKSGPTEEGSSSVSFLRPSDRQQVIPSHTWWF